MSSFLWLYSNELEEYLAKLDTLTLAKKMEEQGMYVDKTWNLYENLTPYYLMQLFDDDLAIEESKYWIRGPLSRSGRRQINSFLKEHFVCERAFDRIEFKVLADGTIYFDLDEDRSYYRCFHCFFDDFVTLKGLWKSLRERKDQYDQQRRAS